MCYRCVFQLLEKIPPESKSQGHLRANCEDLKVWKPTSYYFYEQCSTILALGDPAQDLVEQTIQISVEPPDYNLEHSSYHLPSRIHQACKER